MIKRLLSRRDWAQLPLVMLVALLLGIAMSFGLRVISPHLIAATR